MDTQSMSVVEAVSGGHVKVLSLWQAWASVLVANPVGGRWKSIETRSWSHPYRGWLLIHAAKAMNPDVLASLARSRELFKEMYAGLTSATVQGKQIGMNFVPLGCIVGAVRVDGMVSTEELIDRGLSDVEMSWGDYSPDRFGWLTSNAIAFGRPIPCIGRQKLFDLDTELRDRVLEELGAARERELGEIERASKVA